MPSFVYGLTVAHVNSLTAARVTSTTRSTHPFTNMRVGLTLSVKVLREGRQFLK